MYCESPVGDNAGTKQSLNQRPFFVFTAIGYIGSPGRAHASEPRARLVGLPLLSRWWMFGALTGSFALDGSGVSGNLVAVGNLGKPCDVTRLCDNFGRCHTQGVCSVLQPSCAVAGEPL